MVKFGTHRPPKDVGLALVAGYPVAQVQVRP